MFYGPVVGTIALTVYFTVVLSQTFLIGPFVEGFGFRLPNKWLIAAVQSVAVSLPVVLFIYYFRPYMAGR